MVKRLLFYLECLVLFELAASICDRFPNENRGEDASLSIEGDPGYFMPSTVYPGNDTSVPNKNPLKF